MTQRQPNTTFNVNHYDALIWDLLIFQFLSCDAFCWLIVIQVESDLENVPMVQFVISKKNVKSECRLTFGVAHSSCDFVLLFFFFLFVVVSSCPAGHGSSASSSNETAAQKQWAQQSIKPLEKKKSPFVHIELAQMLLKYTMENICNWTRFLMLKNHWASSARPVLLHMKKW